MGKTAYCFDLDGTVTRKEVLPVIAAEVGLTEEISFLTQMTIAGQIPFDMSFRLRCALLKDIPLDTVSQIVDSVPLDEEISEFIQQNSDQCYVVTGNLDIWVSRLIARLGCGYYSSTAEPSVDLKLGRLTSILRKSSAVRDLRARHERIVCVGEGFNDLPMFEEADIGIAYAGVHPPAREVVDVADYVVKKGVTLCRLLSTL